MKQLIMVAALLLLPLSAGAVTYSWTDASGTVHFTDDIGAVPKKHRAKALRQAAGETAAAPVPAARPTEPAAAVPAAAAPSTESAPSAAAQTQGTAATGPGVTPATRFGDRTAAQWQTEFRALRSELQGLEQQLEAARQETTERNAALLTRQQIEALNARNKQVSEAYEAARLRFNQLVEQANKVGLPPEFGQ